MTFVEELLKLLDLAGYRFYSKTVSGDDFNLIKTFTCESMPGKKLLLDITSRPDQRINSLILDRHWTGFAPDPNIALRNKVKEKKADTASRS